LFNKTHFLQFSNSRLGEDLSQKTATINQNNLLKHQKRFYFQTALTSPSQDNIKRRAIAKTSTSTFVICAAGILVAIKSTNSSTSRFLLLCRQAVNSITDFVTSLGSD